MRWQRAYVYNHGEYRDRQVKVEDGDPLELGERPEICKGNGELIDALLSFGSFKETLQVIF